MLEVSQGKAGCAGDISTKPSFPMQAYFWSLGCGRVVFVEASGVLIVVVVAENRTTTFESG